MKTGILLINLGTPDNPMLIIYKIIPEQVRFMREWALEYHEVTIN